MAKKTTGKVSQFGAKGYGFIAGDDGEQYFAHQKNIVDNTRLKTNMRVVFNAERSDKGLVAMNVALEQPFTNEPKPLSDGAIKAMFSVLFIMQLIVAYKVFMVQ